MSDHKHEWITETKDNQTCYAYCNIRGCNEQLDYHEIERRLNACEILNAEDANRAADVIYDEFIGTAPDEVVEKWVNSLRGYAELRGED